MQSNTCIAYYEIFCEISFFSLQIYPKTLFFKKILILSPFLEMKENLLHCFFFVEIKRLFVSFFKLLIIRLKTSLFLIHVKSVFFIMIASELKTLH